MSGDILIKENIASKQDDHKSIPKSYTDLFIQFHAHITEHRDAKPKRVVKEKYGVTCPRCTKYKQYINVLWIHYINVEIYCPAD